MNNIFELDIKYFTEAKELSSGIFWVLTDDPNIQNFKFIYFDIPCDVYGNPTVNNNIQFNTKNGKTYNHEKFWDEYIKNNNMYKPYNRKKYNYYPRGRVVISNNRADIYLNPHVNREDIINTIKIKFGLNSNTINNIRIMNDNSIHYKCFLDN